MYVTYSLLNDNIKINNTTFDFFCKSSFENNKLNK